VRSLKARTLPLCEQWLHHVLELSETVGHVQPMSDRDLEMWKDMPRIPPFSHEVVSNGRTRYRRLRLLLDPEKGRVGHAVICSR